MGKKGEGEESSRDAHANDKVVDIPTLNDTDRVIPPSWDSLLVCCPSLPFDGHACILGGSLPSTISRIQARIPARSSKRMVSRVVHSCLPYGEMGQMGHGQLLWIGDVAPTVFAR